MTMSTLLIVAMVASAARGEGGNAMVNLDARVGQPVDIAPWCYIYRADAPVQRPPEAYFIPRRLDRMEKVYRKNSREHTRDELKSYYYALPDLFKPFPPTPTGALKTGLLWAGGLADYRVELRWPGKPPMISKVDVRAYPDAWGWFGWTVDKVLTDPVVSPDGRTWTYKSDPTEMMDTFYNNRIPAATEMIAVFVEGDNAPIPSIAVVGPSMGNWKRMDVEIEWGFATPTKNKEFDVRFEPYMAQIGSVAPLSNDDGTTVDGSRVHSHAGHQARRGVRVPVLYAPDARLGLDSRITLWSENHGFTFSLKDLDKGPIYVPREGVFIAKARSGTTAAEFLKGLVAKNPQGVRQMTREHAEASSWEQLLREARLWRCPQGTTLKPYPSVPAAPVEVDLPDPGWTAAWNTVTNQLRGRNMWGGLAYEVGRVAHEMDMIGLHAEANRIYDYFLKTPGVKSDGDYSDGIGALEWAKDIKYGMGYSHDGTHASTGRLLFAMAERYFLTGDRAWFDKNRARLQAAADWIIRQRRTYMKDVPNRKDLFVSGLMPPYMLGDYAMPTDDWRWYYVDNALSLQGLQRFADALADFDAKEGRRYHAEAAAFRKDLRRVLDKEIALAPVRLGQDGAYHSYIPRIAYARGLTGDEIGAPQFPDCDMFTGALPLAEPFAAMDASDARMVDDLNLMEEMGTCEATVRNNEKGRAKRGLSPDDAWFWTFFVRLPKASHNANIYLLQDDVPGFLRFWENTYASVVGADGRLWEPWHPDDYNDCDAPDNGTAGWFMENFRDMLVQEEGPNLWVARGTPRAWLQQGKRIAVKNAPTYFGDLGYEIVSDVDHGKITATIEVPSRRPVRSVILRLRHPRALPIKSVTVDGRVWNTFDPAKEVVFLRSIKGTVTVAVNY
jgi:hypothetical protein